MVSFFAFLREFNGVSLISPVTDITLTALQFQSDASGWGEAAVFKDEWFQIIWSGPGCVMHIVVREFLPIILTFHVWGRYWRHSRLHFLCDNEVVVEVINKQSAKDPLMLALLHYATSLPLRFDFFIHATHIPGSVNDKADHLSHFQASLDFLHALALQPTPIPQDVLHQLTL